MGGEPKRHPAAGDAVSSDKMAVGRVDSGRHPTWATGRNQGKAQQVALAHVDVVVDPHQVDGSPDHQPDEDDEEPDAGDRRRPAAKMAQCRRAPTTRRVTTAPTVSRPAPANRTRSLVPVVGRVPLVLEPTMGVKMVVAVVPNVVQALPVALGPVHGSVCAEATPVSEAIPRPPPMTAAPNSLGMVRNRTSFRRGGSWRAPPSISPQCRTLAPPTPAQLVEEALRPLAPAPDVACRAHHTRR